MSKLRRVDPDEPCVRCGNVGSTVLAHYSGLRQHSYGKGRGIKGSDLAAALLCGACHDFFDSYKTPNDWERSEEFLHLCMLTVIRRHAMGVI